MADLDPTSLAVGLGVGGALLLLMFNKLTTSSEPEAPAPVKAPAKPKPKAKSKSKKAKKKKAAKPQQVKPQEEKKPEPKPVVEEKKAENKPQPAAKKKKKKKKKVVQEPVVDVKEEIQVAKVQVPKSTQPEPIEEGWETVPMKSKSRPRKKVDTVSSKSETASKVVDIGDSIQVIVGPGGATIRNIEDVSGASVKTDRIQKTCTITGSPEQVNIATQMVNNTLADQDIAVVSLESRVAQTIMRNGENLKNIQNLSGARLDIKVDAESGSVSCTITGGSKKVAAAKKLVADYLAGKGPDGGMEVLKFASHHGRLIIGRKGANVQSLQLESGADINVDIQDPYATVTVMGSKDVVAKGVAAINRFVLDHSVSAVVALDPSAIGTVLKQLNSLRENSDVRLDVSDDRTTVKLIGTQKEVADAKSTIIGWIDAELGPPKVGPGEILETIKIGSAAGKVIGRSGATITRLESEAPGASIKIKQGNVCYVSGKPESVKKIKEQIEEIVAKHNETVARVQQEEKALTKTGWSMQTGQPVSASKDAASNTAIGNDWGGFQAALQEGW